MIKIDTLNPEQREAVENTNGPTLVLAGAGSGKTRVLTYKIAYLVSLGIKPWRILAVTFTNKAAREMASRVETLLKIPVRDLWIGTFHSICVRILRREADNWGFKRDFSIYDDDDRMGIINKALKEMGIPKERLSPGKMKGMISKAKNDFLSPQELNSMVSGRDAELMLKVYSRYNELLNQAGAFDFDDLLARPVEMFQKYPESLERWKARFDHVLVDEYQDTNKAQYLLMRLLASGKGDITVVGDDDQSIYSWRGADISNILGFEKDFKRAKTIRLERNYRSTSSILKTANAVVDNNKNRMRKNLWTDGPEGEKVKVLECMNDRDEAERVVGAIQAELSELDYSFGDFAILYRTNSQSRAFEDVLRRRAVKYVIIGGVRFYERKEIKDILAYLRLLVNSDDTVSFMRAIGVPKRGIGPKTLEILEHLAASKKTNIIEALQFAREVLSGVTLKKLEDFAALMRDLSKMRAEKATLDSITQEVVYRIDYEAFIKIEEPENFEDRLDNVNELITAMGEFENPTEEDDLSAFLAEVTLVSDIDSLEEGSNAVTLMTLHAAKGLEYKSVFIAGVEMGIFPLPVSFDTPACLEEERRLFYVGITRAKERLHVSYALSRMRYGSFTGGASMFISEMPDETIQIDAPEKHFTFRSGAGTPIRKRMEFEDYPQVESCVQDSGVYAVGSYVRHPQYGRGKIMDKRGSGDNLTLTVMFGATEKKLVVKFAKLMPG